MSKKKPVVSKGLEAHRTAVCAGIDVSAATLAAAVQQEGGFGQKEFVNSAFGHRQLIAWLRQCGGRVRVSLEAAGTYSLDVALALDEAEGIELAVLNPKTVNRFAETLRRSKTNKADAQALAEYSRRMEFIPWQRPSRAALALRALVGGRHDQHRKAFYRLLQTPHKTKRQAIMAVARKILHAIFGILKTGTGYQGAKLFPQLIHNS
jgi:transposase